jgi:hypothetical protein
MEFQVKQNLISKYIITEERPLGRQSKTAPLTRIHLIIPPILTPQHQSKIHISAVLCATKLVNIMKQGTTEKL